MSKDEIDIRKVLEERKQITIVWSIEDVQAVRSDLTDEQAWDVLSEVRRKHDAERGICWQTLSVMAGILFPSAK
ncbi:MAG TPA: hypothetical protein VFE62_20065 [Gemmataceae bacterium]|nr:hypothetical protein [Gemmataceae bacterium]